MSLPILPTEKTLEDMTAVLVLLNDIKEAGSLKLNDFMQNKLNMTNTRAYRMKLLLRAGGLIASRPEPFAKNNQKIYSITDMGIAYLGEVIRSSNYDAWNIYFKSRKSINKSGDNDW